MLLWLENIGNGSLSAIGSLLNAIHSIRAEVPGHGHWTWAWPSGLKLVAGRAAQLLEVAAVAGTLRHPSIRVQSYGGTVGLRHPGGRLRWALALAINRSPLESRPRRHTTHRMEPAIFVQKWRWPKTDSSLRQRSKRRAVTAHRLGFSSILTVFPRDKHRGTT